MAGVGLVYIEFRAYQPQNIPFHMGRSLRSR